MGAGIRIPLQVLMPCLAVSLVACGAAAIGIAGTSAAGAYLTRQADDHLRACVSSMLSHAVVAAPGSGRMPPGTCDMELLGASGQLLGPAAPGTARPAIPASGSWLAAHLARPVTLPGAGTSGRSRVVVEAVRYQPQRILFVYGPDDVKYVISGRTGRGSSGLLVVMAGLAGTGRAAAAYAAAAGTVLVLLAAAALILTRAILRPLRQAAEFAEGAGQAAGDGPGRVMECLGVLAKRSHWPCGMTLARMPGQLRASREAETAARRSAAEMSELLAEVGAQLRRPVSIVHGYTECWRHQRPPPAGLYRMLQRVADEATRMETLVEELRLRSAGGSTGPDLRLGPRAPRPGHLADPQPGRPDLPVSSDRHPR